MGWYLDTTQITVTSIESSNEQIIAKLQPLANGSVYHIFGYADEVIKVNCLVVGFTDKLAIKGYTKDAATHTFSYVDLIWGTATWGGYTWLVKTASFTLLPTIKQSFRPDLSCTSPVWECTMELHEVVT